MKKHFLPVAVAAAAILTAAAASPDKSDPVVMNINGKDIHRSEFKYLYEKNNLQQVQPQTIDEYVDMFVVYKLKVADAEAAGIDTTETFLKEYNGYCSDLSRPYMRDSLVEEQLVQEAYGRMSTLREVSHIMLPLGSTYAETQANRQRLDSIRTAILNGADFGEMAMRFSSDRSALKNKGNMGYVAANAFPYPFEKASFETPVGQISEVIEDAPYGFHIIKVTGEKPNPGTVRARHILKLTQGLSSEDMAMKKAQIDSIHSLLVSGADFADIAKRESDDKGSAIRGGDLGEFGTGRMVPQFEEVAFALKDGEISEPFLSPFGYHIIQNLGHGGIPTLEKARPQIRMVMARDSRSTMPEKARLADYRTRYGIAFDNDALESLKSSLVDRSDLESLRNSTLAVVKLPEGKLTAADVYKEIPENVREATTDPFGTFKEAADRVLDDATKKYVMDRLAIENTEYRNITNEYRDGILLFEISNRNVWGRSTSDPDALEAYFKANRSKYTDAWDSPRFKGYVVLASNDSVASAAREFLAANTEIENDSLVARLRDNFNREVKLERVLAAKGENDIIDEIAFGGEKAKPVGKWAAWFPYRDRLIEAPEEVADIRGTVTTDYQQQLETEWVNDMRSRYKVKLNKKELKKLSE